MLPPDIEIEAIDARFLADAISGLTTHKVTMTPTAWAECKRYLPPDLSPLPGKFRMDVTPYIQEILDCMGPESPVRKCAVMKGGQVAATTAILENALGFWIDEVPGGILNISADLGLAQTSMELRVERMLHHSGLGDKLRAPDGRTKRSGDKALFKQFPGGWIAAFGARSGAKLRSLAARYALLDELDGMPIVVGNVGREEGNPIDLVEKRTDSFVSTRKILYLSTPLQTSTSLIHPLYLAGDRREYQVPCVHCNAFAALEWHGQLKDGTVYGMVFEHENGKIIPESVGMKCQFCAGVMRNYDKSRFLPDGKWVPTAETTEEGLVSYHIPALLAPVGMYSWEAMAASYLKLYRGATRTGTVTGALSGQISPTKTVERGSE